MPALNFQRKFAPGIMAMLDKNFATRTGIKPKITTIRAQRKHQIKKGDTLYLYVGQRTKQCKLLGSTPCKKIEGIFIDENREGPIVKVDGFRLSLAEAQKVAETDGFESLQAFVRWFKLTHGLPFVGTRYHFINTYQRKYFCTKSVKDRGFGLVLETTQKTILVKPDQVEAAKEDRYVRELAEKHNYGVQTVMDI